MPLILLKSMAPLNPRSSMTRSSSATEASGAFKGSVASAAKRSPRSLHDADMASLTMRASSIARSGDSTWVPGVVKAQDLFAHPRPCQDIGPEGDVPVSGHQYVVISGIVNQGIPFGVQRHLDIAGAGLNGLEIFRRIKVVMKVDDRHLQDSFPCSILAWK